MQTALIGLAFIIVTNSRRVIVGTVASPSFFMSGKFTRMWAKVEIRAIHALIFSRAFHCSRFARAGGANMFQLLLYARDQSGSCLKLQTSRRLTDEYRRVTDEYRRVTDEWQTSTDE